ncbi:hypothetical protein GCM10028808_64340 [Spirosoma migulaei]
MSIFLAGLLGFIGFCWILLDLYLDIKLGHYEQQPLDILVEAGVIIAYCYVAFRFIQYKLNNLQPPTYSPSDATRASHQSSGWFGKAFQPAKRPKLG